MKKALKIIGDALFCLVVAAIVAAVIYYKFKKVEFFLSH